MVYLTIFTGSIMFIFLCFKIVRYLICFYFKCITHNITKILEIRNTAYATTKEEICQNHLFFFFIIEQFSGNFAVSFDLYISFFASENDSWVFLTRKDHDQSLLNQKKFRAFGPCSLKCVWLWSLQVMTQLQYYTEVDCHYNLFLKQMCASQCFRS